MAIVTTTKRVLKEAKAMGSHTARIPAVDFLVCLFEF
jgi:hypothetical protein